MPSTMRILRADNGTEVTLEELLRTVERPNVWSMDAKMHIAVRRMTWVESVGRAAVFRVRLASGRLFEATGGQELLTVDGWVSLKRLGIDHRVATPRSIPEPLSITPMVDAEVVLLAHMIGDGSCVKRQPIRYASIDEENLAAVAAAATHFGVTAIRDDYAAARVTTLRLPAPFRLARGRRNPIAEWLDGLGLFGLRSYDKFVPSRVFELPNRQIALFLQHLWATDGSVRWDARGRQARVYYASTSRRLVDDVAQLLLRMGVHGRIKVAHKAGYRDGWHLTIDGADNQTVFLGDVGVHGARGVSAAEVLTELAPMPRNTNVDTIPKEIWDKVRASFTAKGMSHRDFQAAMGSAFCGSAMWRRSPSRQRLARVAALLDDPHLAMVATSDIFWDRIVEITELGEKEVLRASVSGTGNLFAHGVVVRAASE
ncbi:LAGLIDADG family homing endonuclease [Nocardia sp. NPDC050406]|uniref:LAGLIDADG family homing endonuclease n=1 Tax=Nocardia sp. NPDC050406 TaxID=3364318 RepID=UPI00379836B4